MSARRINNDIKTTTIIYRDLEMALEFPTDKTSYKGTVNFTVVGDVGGQIGATCTLYLPQGIQIADKVEYENADLGLGGAGIEAAAGGSKTAESDIASYVDQAGMGGGMGQMVANITKKFDGSGIANGVRAVNRRAPNPNTRALFKQVSLRAFAFTFKLVPVSREEAASIPEIIKFFRTELYPKEEKAGDVSLGYKFPNQFKITMMYDGQEVGTPIKECYLESFMTNYNPSSQAMHSDGNFAEVDISMNFLEGKALSRTDIENGDA